MANLYKSFWESEWARIVSFNLYKSFWGSQWAWICHGNFYKMYELGWTWIVLVNFYKCFYGSEWARIALVNFYKVQYREMGNFVGSLSRAMMLSITSDLVGFALKLSKNLLLFSGPGKPSENWMNFIKVLSSIKSAI